MTPERQADATRETFAGQRIEVVSWEHALATWREFPASATLFAGDPAQRERLAHVTGEACALLAQVQAGANARGNDAPRQRALNTKTVYMTRAAELHVSGSLPSALAGGWLRAGALWPARVRLSGAGPVLVADGVRDQRSLGVTLVSDSRRQDLLTSGPAPVSHAGDPEAFVASLHGAALRTSGVPVGKLRLLATVSRRLARLRAMVATGRHEPGLRTQVARLPRALADTLTMAKRADDGTVDVSLAATPFFSRLPFRLGSYAVQYAFVPAVGTHAMLLGSGGREALLRDLVARQHEAPVRFRLLLRGHDTERRAPLTSSWQDWHGPWVEAGQLVVTGSGGEAAALREAAELAATTRATPFNYWAPGVFEPLGPLNALRREVYRASSVGRGVSERDVPS